MSIQNQTKPLTEAQRKNLAVLKSTFGISDADLERVLFFSDRPDDPWIPPDLLESIARQHGGYQEISLRFDQYIDALGLILYQAVVVDEQGRRYARSGAASLGEKPAGREIDPQTLAGGRALGAALRAAGFDPFRAGSVVSLERHRQPSYSPPLSPQELELQRKEDEAQLRSKDLRQIHALAEQKGLIVGKDMSRYRAFLLDKFGTVTAGILNHTERQAVIAAINNYGFEDYLATVPPELQADALVA
jgi:hypothetical protein